MNENLLSENLFSEHLGDNNSNISHYGLSSISLSPFNPIIVEENGLAVLSEVTSHEEHISIGSKFEINCSSIPDNSSYLENNKVISNYRKNNENSYIQTPDNFIVQCLWNNCNKNFSTVNELDDHLVNNHLKLQNNTFNILSNIQYKKTGYICRWKDCDRHGKPMKSRTKIIDHLRRHSKLKPFKCQSCNKIFSNNPSLRNHYLTHLTIKHFTCHYENCHLAFSNSSDRSKHIRVYHQNRLYSCSYDGCSKLYKDPSALRKHVKSIHKSIKCSMIQPISTKTYGNNMYQSKYYDGDDQINFSLNNQSTSNNVESVTSEFTNTNKRKKNPKRQESVIISNQTCSQDNKSSNTTDIFKIDSIRNAKDFIAYDVMDVNSYMDNKY